MLACFVHLTTSTLGFGFKQGSVDVKGFGLYVWPWGLLNCLAQVVCRSQFGARRLMCYRHMDIKNYIYINNLRNKTRVLWVRYDCWKRDSVLSAQAVGRG